MQLNSCKELRLLNVVNEEASLGQREQVASSDKSQRADDYNVGTGGKSLHQPLRVDLHAATDWSHRQQTGLMTFAQH